MIRPRCTKQSNLSRENIIKPNAVYIIVRDQFKTRFNDSKESKLKLVINPLLLDTSITKNEVAKCIHKLPNNRAPGYDQMSTELLRYASPELHDLIAESLNNKTRIQLFKARIYQCRSWIPNSLIETW